MFSLGRRELFEAARFGVVGVIATIVHLGGFAALVEFLAVRPVWANVIGFAAAMVVGFCGHHWWTFREQHAPRRDVAGAGSRYAVITLTGFGVSSAIVYLVTEVASAPYEYAIALILAIVPGSQFLMSKFWAFRAASDSSRA